MAVIKVLDDTGLATLWGQLKTKLAAKADLVNGKIPAAQLDVQKGDKGDDGKSAYELAVAGGYSGTVAQWLASLKGEKGDPGNPGTTYSLTSADKTEIANIVYGLLDAAEDGTY